MYATLDGQKQPLLLTVLSVLAVQHGLDFLQMKARLLCQLPATPSAPLTDHFLLKVLQTLVFSLLSLYCPFVALSPGP